MLAYMGRTTVLVPDQVEAKLRHEADVRGLTYSDVVREALERHAGARRPRSIASGDSGRSDISARVDEILAEEYEHRDARRRSQH